LLIARPDSALAFACATLGHAIQSRHTPVLLALTPAQQYAEQQAAMREARMRRVQAEERAANAPPVDRALVEARAAELEQFKADFSSQLSLFDGSLYPEEAYKARNDASRKDGYWAFVSKGEEPPLDATYGEFPLPLFNKLIDRACDIAGVGEDRSSTVIADLGSGTGRLALWAASTSEWESVRGVEYLPAIAATAAEKLAELQEASPDMLRTNDVQLVEGSWEDPLDVFDGIDLAFAYTTAITANDEGILENLSAALSDRLRRGSLVITTEYRLDPTNFEVLDEIDGENPGAGGRSTGIIHRKICVGERDLLDGSADHAALNGGSFCVEGSHQPKKRAQEQTDRSQSPHEVEFAAPPPPRPRVQQQLQPKGEQASVDEVASAPVLAAVVPPLATPAGSTTSYKATGGFADADAARQAWLQKQTTPAAAVVPPLATPAGSTTSYKATGGFADADAARQAWLQKQTTPASVGAKDVSSEGRDGSDGDDEKLADLNAEAAARRAAREAKFGVTVGETVGRAPPAATASPIGAHAAAAPSPSEQGAVGEVCQMEAALLGNLQAAFEQQEADMEEALLAAFEGGA